MARTTGKRRRAVDIAPHERFRIHMVVVAMKRIARHPNWCRGFGFAVGEAWWPEFLASLGAVKDELEDQIGREAEALARQGQRLAAIPKVLDVISMAVFQLLSERKVAWPLPVGAPQTFEAMGRFLVAEKARGRVASDSECDGVERAEEWGSGEMAGGKRVVH
jgi:hypothetical protein